MTTIESFGAEKATAASAHRVDERKVWDVPVRLFHWALAASIVGAFVTNRLGVAYFAYHVLFGYAVIVLVAFRVIWGFVGTRHALFVNFVRGPIVTLRYAARLARGEKVHYLGHNPLGAWMVLALLVLVGAQAGAGLFSDDEIFNVGPLNGYASKEIGLLLTSLHRKLFYWIAGAIAIHLLAVFAHRAFGRENLARAMITGRKARRGASDDEFIHSSRSWLAALLVASIGVAFAVIVKFAPAPLADPLF